MITQLILSGLILIFGLASPALLAQSQNACGAIPQQYLGSEYGATRYALEKPCIRKLSAKEQLFVAGVAQQLQSRCRLIRDPDLEKFLSASVLVAAIGGKYKTGTIGEGLEDQVTSTAAYAAGAALAKETACDSTLAKAWTAGIVAYLKATSHNSSYVDGCARFYQGRYTREQCQCLGDIGRSVMPGIHDAEFSRSSIQELIQRNPFVGFQVGIRCRIGDY